VLHHRGAGSGARARINLGYPLYYPLPAVVLTLPLALLPLEAARLAFAIGCGFIAGYGLQRCGLYAPLWISRPSRRAAIGAIALRSANPAGDLRLSVAATLAISRWLWTRRLPGP
jgi:hypothetical protein